MRIAIPSTARPSIVQRPCLMRNKYGCWKRSRATSAEALYTITMLAHTSSRVAVNRILSDLRVRATDYASVTKFNNLLPDPYCQSSSVPKQPLLDRLRSDPREE